MKRLSGWPIIFIAALLFVGSFVTYQYREARSAMEASVRVENYPQALERIAKLRESILLLPLRWGTPFFLRNIAGDVRFIESESWYRLGERRKALKSYIASAELFTDSEKRKRVSAYYNAAVITLELREYIQARDLLHRALDPVRGDPHHAGAKANLERLEWLAAESDLFSFDGESGRYDAFWQRDTSLDPWASKLKKERSKSKERRR